MLYPVELRAHATEEEKIEIYYFRRAARKEVKR